jgi:hypothetical protein
MSEIKPKRRWFRFHLLTAVLMMVTAGGMVGANSIRHTSPELLASPFTVGYGWPEIALSRPDDEFIQMFEDIRVPTRAWNKGAIVVNVLVAVLVISVAGFLCESLLRRREGRNP